MTEEERKQLEGIGVFSFVRTVRRFHKFKDELPDGFKTVTNLCGETQTYVDCLNTAGMIDDTSRDELFKRLGEIESSHTEEISIIYLKCSLLEEQNEKLKSKLRDT